MFGQTLFQPNGRNVWAYLSSHGASDWHFKLMWRHTFVCFHTTVSQYHFRFCPGKAREGGLAADKGRHVFLRWAVDRDGILELLLCCYLTNVPVVQLITCNWLQHGRMILLYESIQYPTVPYWFIAHHCATSLARSSQAPQRADLLFRGFAPNVPQNLPQQSQCAVRWVVVLPRDIQTYPNRISIECHSIGKPTCCRRFVASRWWSLWGQYLQF